MFKRRQQIFALYSIGIDGFDLQKHHRLAGTIYTAIATLTSHYWCTLVREAYSFELNMCRHS